MLAGPHLIKVNAALLQKTMCLTCSGQLSVGTGLSMVHGVTVKKELVYFRRDKSQQLQGLEGRCRLELVRFFASHLQSC